jgi:hypothetical protein
MTPLSKRAKPFVPLVDASPTVAWMPVLLFADVVVKVSESVQNVFEGQNAQQNVAKPLRGRAKTRGHPKQLRSRTPSPSRFSVCLSEASTTTESWFTKEDSIADISNLSDPADYQGEVDDPPVKNTFVHFAKEHFPDCSGAALSGERQLSRSSSAPSIVLTCPFKRYTLTEMHQRGQCNPCAYFYSKADGCRLGSQCKFCHLCPMDEIKSRKKQRSKELKARKVAAKAALEAEASDPEQPKNAVDVA